MRSTLSLFACGTLFGSGLAISGMTDPRKVIGFLDLAGRWDPSLAIVMGGALLAFAGTLRVAGRPPTVVGGPIGSWRDLVDRRLVVGSAVFGIGWGLGGFCPGPALARLSTAQTEAVVFVVAMAVGMVIAQRKFGADLTD